MVVTSKVLGLTLLSALSLAAPFEDSGLAARNADAVAEALLQFADIEARHAEPEAWAEAEPEAAFDFGGGQLAERDVLEELEFALQVLAQISTIDVNELTSPGPIC